MANKYERIQIFEETMALCKNDEVLRTEVTKSISGQRIFWQDEEIGASPEKQEDETKIFLVDERTVKAGERYAKQGLKVCILNFASSVTPGGGVVRGTTAQEESICRITSLYPALIDEETAAPFYTKHKDMIETGQMGRENRDDCIFTPNVMVIREDDYDCQLLSKEEWYKVDVITCAAPDLRTGSYNNTDPELIKLLDNRIKQIFDVALYNKEEVLILGAFGCGVFGNSPAVVARIFRRHIESYYANVFKTIVFAIPDKSSINYMSFYDEFNEKLN